MVGIYVGRANVGKSSLLNALVNQKNLLSTSKKAVSKSFVYLGMVLNLSLKFRDIQER